MTGQQGIAPGTTVYGRYRIDSVLGIGGFGITYLAVDVERGTKVALKEYFPAMLAVRDRDTDAICVMHPEKEKEYQKGKERFVREAVILEQYRFLDGIVKVLERFEANRTVYIAMEYIDGMTLKEYIPVHGGIAYAELMDMLSPVLHALMTLHKHGVVHRDISPDNLMITMDNSLCLIDFGAARDVRDVRRGGSSTVLLKEGYAPPEQYLPDGELGAWTDVYGLSATIYYALGKVIPETAISRVQGRRLKPLTEMGVLLEEWQWKALEKGLAVRKAERYRNVEELYNALTVPPSSEDVTTVCRLRLSFFLRRKMRWLSREFAWGQENGFKVFVRVAGVLLLAGGVLLLLQAGLGRREGQLSAGGAEVPGGRAEIVKQEMPSTVEADSEYTGGEEMPSSAGLATEEKAGGETSLATANASDRSGWVLGAQAVSSPRVCRMPDVVGMTETDAVVRIRNRDASIQIRITEKYHSQAEQGVVISQNVEPDTRYNEGAIGEILLTVSRGAEPQEDGKRESTDEKTETDEEKYKVRSDGNEIVHIRLKDVQ